MLILFLIIHGIQACPSSPPATTTTIAPTILPNLDFFPDYELANSLQYNQYWDGCPSFFISCIKTKIKFQKLFYYSRIKFEVDSGKYVGLVRTRAHELQGAWMNYYETGDYDKFYDEAVVMFDDSNIRATLQWNEGYNRHFRYIIYQPMTGLTVIAQTGRSFAEEAFNGYSFTASDGNYGFRASDDALSWFLRSTSGLDDANLELFNRGRRDNKTVVTVSVTIKYTPEFLETLGVFPKYGLYHLTAFTMKHLNEIFSNNHTMITFEFRCATQALVENDEDGGDDDLKLYTLLGEKVDYEMQKKKDGEAFEKILQSSSRQKRDLEMDTTFSMPDGKPHEARHSADLVIAFVHSLSSGAGKAFPYQMHHGLSGVMIRFDGIFDSILLAHQVGHVLGAGHDHGKGPIDGASGSMYYAQGIHTGPHLCSIMAVGKVCRHVPYFSSPQLEIEEKLLKEYFPGLWGPVVEDKPGVYKFGMKEERDNTRWIKENRFILSKVGNENITCDKDPWSLKPKVVDCLNFMRAMWYVEGFEINHITLCDNYLRASNSGG